MVSSLRALAIMECSFPLAWFVTLVFSTKRKSFLSSAASPIENWISHLLSTLHFLATGDC